MFNKPVKFNFTSSSHYCVNMMNNNEQSVHHDNNLEVDVEAAQEQGSEEEKLALQENKNITLLKKLKNTDQSSQTVWPCLY